MLAETLTDQVKRHHPMMSEHNWRIAIGIAAFALGCWLGLACGGAAVVLLKDDSPAAVASTETIPVLPIRSQELADQLLAAIPLTETMTPPGTRLRRLGLSDRSGRESIVIWDHGGQVAEITCDHDVERPLDARAVAIVLGTVLDDAGARSAIKLIDSAEKHLVGDWLSLERSGKVVLVYRTSPTTMQITLKPSGR